MLNSKTKLKTFYANSNSRDKAAKNFFRFSQSTIQKGEKLCLFLIPLNPTSTWVKEKLNRVNTLLRLLTLIPLYVSTLIMLMPISFGAGGKMVLGRTWQAKQDLKTALKLATHAGDVQLKKQIKILLRKLK